MVLWKPSHPGFKTYVFVHTMQIMFTANKFIFPTLFLQGVWAHSDLLWRENKEVHEILLITVPRFPETFKTQAQIISKSYFINLQDNRCVIKCFKFKAGEKLPLILSFRKPCLCPKWRSYCLKNRIHKIAWTMEVCWEALFNPEVKGGF